MVFFVFVLNIYFLEDKTLQYFDEPDERNKKKEVHVGVIYAR